MAGLGECKGPVGILTEQQEKDIARMLNKESYNMHYGLRNGSYFLRNSSEARIDMAMGILKVLGYCIKETESVKAPDGVRYPIYEIIRISKV
ncbi:MAG: hypothetical protein ACI4TD_09090 [Phocaeicola sp.]